MSRIAGEVIAIERHAELAELARARLERLGYDNVRDPHRRRHRGCPKRRRSTRSWSPRAAPTCRRRCTAQLAIGGRAGHAGRRAERGAALVKVTRAERDGFEEEDLGAVRVRAADRRAGLERMAPASATHRIEHARVAELIAEAAEPLPELDDPAFAAAVRPLRRRAGGAAGRGQPRHLGILPGARRDHPAADRAARLHHRRGRGRLARRRQPSTAMSATAPPRAGRRAGLPALPDLDVAQHRCRRLRRLAARPQRRPPPHDGEAGFYGLDLYNLDGSIRAVIDYLDKVDPEAARGGARALRLPDALAHDPADLWPHGAHRGLSPVRGRRSSRAAASCSTSGCDYAAATTATTSSTPAQNARLVANAEAYYRVMYYGAAESWNLRDTPHVRDALRSCSRRKGPDAKAVVWAHNSHIGDAALTEMGRCATSSTSASSAASGSATRRALIGFGTHAGTVAAATDWDGPMEVKRVQPVAARQLRAAVPRQRRAAASCSTCARASRRGRASALLRAAARALHRRDLPARDRALEPLCRGASLPKQFDAWVWFDETAAVTPLPTEQPEGGEEET